jgi:hypothetical protein
VFILDVVSSHVFVPLFTQVISVVKARVPLASLSVYVLLAVFVLVKKLVNVFATLRSQSIPFKNVFTHVENVSVETLQTSVSLAPVGNDTVQPDTFTAEILGVVSEGEFENTRDPHDHVSSLITLASSAEVVGANCESFQVTSALSVFNAEKFEFISSNVSLIKSVDCMV